MATLTKHLENLEAQAELKRFFASCVDFEGLGYSEPKENTLQCAAKTLFDEVVKHA